MAASLSFSKAESETRPRLELADVFREFGPEYRRTHPLPLHHRRVMRAIECCRTAALGGHVEACDHCGVVRIAYNSCRNRHCPKCQGSARARWVEKQQADLLPLPYFHLVFTLPDTLLPLLAWNRKLLLDLLFRAAAATLLAFGERHLGGELGITAVLHTWGQTLVEHPHLHCLVPGGALARDGSGLTRCRPDYLFPVRALAQVFRGKYLAGLVRAYARGELRGPPDPITGPGMYAVALRDVRRAKLRRFPYLVYYRVFTDRIEVLGVLHGGQDPQVWQRRT
jgi:plasmid stabilization system protein ParE